MPSRAFFFPFMLSSRSPRSFRQNDNFIMFKEAKFLASFSNDNEQEYSSAIKLWV